MTALTWAVAVLAGVFGASALAVGVRRWASATERTQPMLLVAGAIALLWGVGLLEGLRG